MWMLWLKIACAAMLPAWLACEVQRSAKHAEGHSHMEPGITNQTCNTLDVQRDYQLLCEMLKAFIYSFWKLL